MFESKISLSRNSKNGSIIVVSTNFRVASLWKRSNSITFKDLKMSCRMFEKSLCKSKFLYAWDELLTFKNSLWRFWSSALQCQNSLEVGRCNWMSHIWFKGLRRSGSIFTHHIFQRTGMRSKLISSEEEVEIMECSFVSIPSNSFRFGNNLHEISQYNGHLVKKFPWTFNFFKNYQFCTFWSSHGE